MHKQKRTASFTTQRIRFGSSNLINEEQFRSARQGSQESDQFSQTLLQPLNKMALFQETPQQQINENQILPNMMLYQQNSIASDFEAIIKPKT